jgi:sugar transferase (PEP-CTERM/EpsH1 system associated)
VNITHFVENLERGGLERVVIDLIRAQRDAGHECRVVCLFETGALASELREDGVDVQACGKRTGPDMGAVLRARALLRRQRGGVLHSHNATAHYYAVAAAAGLPWRRVVNTRHSMASPDPRSRMEWLYRRAMPLTDTVVAVCESARRQLERDGVAPRHDLLSIPNGIRVDRFRATTPEARADLARSLGLEPGTRIIGTVGRLHAAKDQATLIRAFALLRAADAAPGAALVIVGEGKLRAQLVEVAESTGVAAHVHLLGDRGDVAALLPGFDLFALSSITEGYSIALMEACAAALPVVATDVGGNSEIVRHDVTGALVPARAPEALAAAMGDMLRQPERSRAMGQAAREWVLAEGSFRTMADRYDRIYSG